MTIAKTDLWQARFERLRSNKLFELVVVANPDMAGRPISALFRQIPAKH